MHNAWDAHYRQVNVLRFTQDGSALLTGSEDSGVSVWSVSRLLDDDLQNELPTPYCTFSDHTLPVTDIVCGVGPFPLCRALTSSLDHSVKLWDLSSKSLLTTFYFPKPVSCLAWDITERLFFAASADGSIHQVNMFRQREDKFGSAALEAVGGAGMNDVVRIDIQDTRTAKKRLISTGDPVSAITISLTSSLLLVGTETGLIQIYDIASHQLLRTVSTHKGLLITHLATMLRPPDLVGHATLSLTVGTETKELPGRPVVPFQRIRDAKARDAHEVSIMLHSRDPADTEVFFSYPADELNHDHAFFVRSETDKGSVGVSLQSRVVELESEVSKLREQLGKAKGINDVMWEKVVKQMVEEGKQKTPEQEMGDPEADDSGRRRKRGRV
ncbi:uncharacterized protein FIBRA_01697 [Fibroporia radiculosa]|uniref:Pre-rRNA-processing protein IPI3 n=1 Tax=Fibroporia radiculosa TaxID=599839 RepID=J4I8M6_9APHY|nr:uncharacterized protein FIBRA_01697 [Fibroporia radiculosa]CCL99676.1 predicted protein [Fibroporia radiculosa]